jgi:hypothetical protein
MFKFIKKIQNRIRVKRLKSQIPAYVIFSLDENDLSNINDVEFLRRLKLWYDEYSDYMSWDNFKYSFYEDR